MPTVQSQAHCLAQRLIMEHAFLLGDGQVETLLAAILQLFFFFKGFYRLSAGKLSL